MSGVKHTLRIEDGANSHFFDGRIMDQDDECLAFVDIHHPMSRLFAAAPDLFEALTEVLEALDVSRNGGEYPPFDAWETKARAALAALQAEQGAK